MKAIAIVGKLFLGWFEELLKLLAVLAMGAIVFLIVATWRDARAANEKVDPSPPVEFHEPAKHSVATPEFIFHRNPELWI